MKRYFFLTCFWLFSCFSVYSQTLFTLRSAIKESFLNNAVLKSEKFNIKVAQSDITTAALRPNPVLNNQTLFLMNRNYFPEGTNRLSNSNRQVWYQLTKPILLGNQRQKRIDFAKQNYTYSEQGYSEVARNLYYEVANQWLELWFNKVNRRILLDAKDNIDTLVDINKNRLKNQAITPIELVRTQLLSDQYILQLKTINQEYQNQVRSLKLLIGGTDSLDIDENDPLSDIVFSENVDTLISLAKRRRVDYLASQSVVELANKNIALQKSLSAPYFEAGVIYNPQNSIIYSGVFATLSLPIFDRNQGEIEKSKYLLDQSKTSVTAKELQIDREIRNANNAFTTNKQNLVFYQDIVKQSQKVLSTVRYSYLKGNTTIIDFLEAQRSYLETQKVYFEAIYNYRKSYVDLLFATGLIMDLNN